MWFWFCKNSFREERTKWMYLFVSCYDENYQQNGFYNGSFNNWKLIVQCNFWGNGYDIFSAKNEGNKANSGITLW